MNTQQRGFSVSLPLGGLLLIVVGGALLLRNFGLLPADFARNLWRLWPLLLVSLGLDMLLGKRLARLFTVVLLILALLALWFVNWLPWAQPEQWPGAPANHRVGLGGDTGTQVELELSSTSLRLGPLPPDSADLLSLDSFGQPPHIESGGWGLPLAPDTPIRIVSPQGQVRGGAALSPRDRWELYLHPSVSLALDISANASRGDIDLSQLAINEFSLTLNASGATVTMPERLGLARAEFGVNASDLTIIVPRDSALRVAIESNLSHITVDGVRQSGVTSYETPGFAEASRRLEITLGANVSRVTIRTATAGAP